MSNPLATYIARRIFECGSDGPNYLAKRIEFKTAPPERPLGGFSEKPLADFIENVIRDFQANPLPEQK